ncbi:cytochrome P450 [Pendulispora rubella]|uniref:Cytochrome P450 n=1 Tax=Pendulispora rubella TaxID=2741070 RepID=A0ABZ2L5K5_9BACT
MPNASLMDRILIATNRRLSILRPLSKVPEGSDLEPVPGDEGLPWLGHTLAMVFLGDPMPFLRYRYDEFGPVSWGIMLGHRWVFPLGPKASEVVLQNRDKAFANGPGWGYWIGPFFHRGIMLLDFEEHLHHRRILQHAFTNERLTGYLEAMGPVIARGIAGWRTGGRFPFHASLKQLTLDVATEVFMGAKLGRESNSINRAFIDTVRAGLSVLRFRVPGGRWSRGLHGRRVLERFFRERLPAKRGSEGSDLFAVLCRATSEDGHRFSDDDVINHMIFLLMAAHDTTTITMTTMAYYLAKYPEWQERLRDESFALGKDDLDFDDLEKLSGLDQVMKEAMRLVAPVPYLARKTVKDTSICGYFVPKDTFVAVLPQFSHHMPEYWSDSERFDPERFAPHRREDKVHPYAWQPFGGGVHKCIGLHFAGIQVKAVFHRIVRRYRWSVAPGYEPTFDFTTLPVPKDGLPVHLEKVVDT